MYKKFFILLFAFILIFMCSCKKKLSNEEITKLYVSAMDYYSDEKYEEALSYIQMIQDNSKGFYQAELLKGKIFFFQDKFEDSEKVFNTLVKEHPEYIEALIWKIRCQILTDKYDEAQSELDLALTFNQTDWRLYYLYALLESYRANYDKEIVMLERAELSLTDSAKVYMEQADIWRLLGLNEKARNALIKAKTVTGTDSSLYELQEAMEYAY